MSSTLANDGDLLDDDLCESTRILISDSMRIMGTGKLRFRKDVKIATTTERSKRTRRQEEESGGGENNESIPTTSSTVTEIHQV